MVNWKIIIILIVIEIERLGLGYLYYNGMENYQSAFVCELKSFAFHGFVCSFIAAISAAIRQISKTIWRWSKKKKKKQWMKKNYCVHRKGKGKRRPKARKKAKKRWCSMEKTQIWGASVSVQFRWIYKIYNILAGESQPHQSTINESQ